MKRPCAGAGAGCGIDLRAVVVVTDLIGEGDVVGVSHPRHACLLRRSAIHRMEVVRNVVAGGAIRIILNLTEAIGGAGRHRATLPDCMIVNADIQAIGGIMHRDSNLIAGVHEQVGS